MLDADDLLETAARSTGLTDYGNFPLREGLERFCRSLRDEARLTAAGVEAARTEILDTLSQRLQIEAFYRAHPETEAEELLPPVMVTGLPRGGTTALSQMLSTDPQLRSIKRWEASWPYPPSRPDATARDERALKMERQLGRQLEVTPEFRTQLQVEADDPTEHYCFLRFTFQSHHYAGFYRTPSYGEWVLSCDMEPAYRYMRRVLKLLQVNHTSRRWNLKHPQDLYQMEAVQSVFPDAILIWNHRDPIHTVPSVASLIVTLRRLNTDNIDKAEIGRAELDRAAMLIERGMAYRDLPEAKSFEDVLNRDIARNPAETLRLIYAKIGLDYSDDFDRTLHERNSLRPKGKYGTHAYTPEEFGLSTAGIDSRFASYTSAFGLKE